MLKTILSYGDPASPLGFALWHLAHRPEDVWAAVSDIGALHHRLVPGFVVDTRLEPGARIVTFGNGMVVRELIVNLDDEARRRVSTAPSSFGAFLGVSFNQRGAVNLRGRNGGNDLQNLNCVSYL